MPKRTDYSGVILRWTLGTQNTTALSEYEKEKYHDFIWLAKLSLVSFQKWFPGAHFVLLYNGTDFEQFIALFVKSSPHAIEPIEYIDQTTELREEKIINPYHFAPRGVWWKWVPFRLDITKNEISIDTDIVCLNEPCTWYEWIESNKPLLIAPERFETVRVNTCGDFATHPLLKGKRPFNCGVVGQRAGHNYADRFFEITKEVELGRTHDSLFITEQGSINLWIRSLETEGVDHYVLHFERNAWMRDFLYFIRKGVKVETVHAVAWYKEIVKALKEVFEKRISEQNYDSEEFLIDILKHSSKFDNFTKFILDRQLQENELGTDYTFLPNNS